MPDAAKSGVPDGIRLGVTKSRLALPIEHLTGRLISGCAPDNLLVDVVGAIEVLEDGLATR